MSDLFGEICEGISLVLAWVMIVSLRFEVKKLRKAVEGLQPRNGS